jgi:hypothetical protein
MQVPPGMPGQPPQPQPPQAPPGPPQMIDQPVTVYKIRVIMKKPANRARFISIPVEEFVINRGARSISEARFCSHRTVKTRAELIEMGLSEDDLDGIGTTNSTSLDFNKEARIRQPGTYAVVSMPASNDPEQDRFEHYESYYRHDMDGDGYAELYKFEQLGVGKKLVRWEPVEDIQIADLCPDPEPHVWAGSSWADRTMDLQIINSHILRNMLDSLAASIFPRMAYVEGQVNVDDVLNTEIGAAIRMRQPGMVQPMEVPFTGQNAMPLVSYLQDVREMRTGISKAAMGLDADALQSTSAVAAQATISAAQSVVELVARLYAEGFRKVMRGLLKMLVRYQDRPMVVRLRDKKYVEVNPQDWDPDMDVTIDVGVGISSEADRATKLAAVIDKMEGVIKAFGPQNPIVSPVGLRNAYADITELAGFKNVDRYWADTEAQLAAAAQQPKQPPPPSPEEIAAQVEMAKANLRKQEKDAELDQENLEMLLSDDRERTRDEMKARVDLAIAAAQTGHQIDAARINALIAYDRNSAAHIASAAAMRKASQQAQVAQ